MLMTIPIVIIVTLMSEHILSMRKETNGSSMVFSDDIFE